MSCRPLRIEPRLRALPGDADGKVRLLDGERGRPQRTRRVCGPRAPECGRAVAGLGAEREAVRVPARRATRRRTARTRSPSHATRRSEASGGRQPPDSVQARASPVPPAPASTRRAVSPRGPGRSRRRGCSANSRARRTARSSPSWRSRRTCGRGSGRRRSSGRGTPCRTRRSGCRCGRRTRPANRPASASPRRATRTRWRGATRSIPSLAAPRVGSRSPAMCSVRNWSNGTSALNARIT